MRSILKNKFSVSAIAMAVAACVAMPSTVFAANNRFSNVVKNTAGPTTEEYLDITLNTDWDYDADVTQSGTGVGAVPARKLDKAYIEALMRQAARTLFVMTNGRHRIGNVYVFKNSRFGADVDVRVINTPGRANASVSGWKAEGGLTTNNYITNKNSDGSLDPENPEQTGEVVAHELGHYVYGLLDEYVEAGKPCQAPRQQMGSPCEGDLVKPTAMNDQSKAYRLSIPSDYAGTPADRTAHSRVYGNDDGTAGSAWETLVRDPAQDPAKSREEHQGRRIRFDAFKDVPVPTLEQLKKYESDGALTRFDFQRGTQAQDSVFFGYDKYLKLIYEGPAEVKPNPRNVLLIDRTVPEATFKEIITAVNGVIDRAPENARFAVVAKPDLGGKQFYFMNAQGKASVKESIDNLTRVQSPVDFKEVYSTARNLIVSARPSAGQSAENAGNTDTVSIFTVSTAVLPENLGTMARDDKIAINIQALVPPASTTPAQASVPQGFSPPPSPGAVMEKLAKASGGSFNTARKADEAIKEASRAFKDAIGESEALIDADLSDDSIKSGTSFETKFQVGSEALDGTIVVRYYFNEKDRNKLTFSCAPVAGGNGGSILVEPTAEGDEEGLATCTISGSRTAGEWVAKSAVAAGGADSELVETEVVSILKGTPLELNATVEGGNLSDNKSPVLTVSLVGKFPIINANIKTEIYNANTGELVKETILNSSNDQGTNGDARANDGVYSLSLNKAFNAGDYYAVVRALTDATNSMFNPVQRFNKSVAPTAYPVGEVIGRLAEFEFSLENGAVGVGATSSTEAGVSASISTGWNLLGLGNNATIDVANALKDETKVSTVWKWLPTTNKWAFYSPTLADGGKTYAAQKGFEYLSTIQGGEGFWVNAKTSFNLQMPAGSIVVAADYASAARLGLNWNLISIGDNKTPVQFNSAITNNPAKLVTLWSWDNAEQNWYFFAPSLLQNNTLNSYIADKKYLNFGTRTLQPASGFWVNMAPKN